VVTDGTAKREAIKKIREEGGIMVGIVVALDGMGTLVAPRGKDKEDKMSTIGAIRREYGIPVLAILTLDDIIRGLGDNGRGKMLRIWRSIGLIR
jgi:orotate phosphoribosyltransferase